MKSNSLIYAITLALLSTTAGAAEVSAEQSMSDANKEGRIWTGFALNRHLKAFDLSVDVDGERAILRGTVEEPIDRELAAQVAMNVSGVKTVENRITVDPLWMPSKRENQDRTIGEMTEDATITASVKSKLVWNEYTNGFAINVDTTNRRVTLRGVADTEQARTIAGRLALNTYGVRWVDNNIEVVKTAERTAIKRSDDGMEQGLADSWITAKVESSFAYSRYVDAFDIDVDTKDGVVKLSGDVSSGAERDLAVELADNVRGVKRVDASLVKINN